MTTLNPEVVPLPAHLSECGCPSAARGRHLTTCKPAQDYKMHDHPEYEMGRRFQAISWDYPLRMRATVDVEVSLDPALYIAAHRQDYDAYEMERGFEEWEKPLCFISEWITRECDDIGMAFAFDRHIARVDTTVDFTSEYPTWTPEDTDRLNATVAEMG